VSNHKAFPPVQGARLARWPSGLGVFINAFNPLETNKWWEIRERPGTIKEMTSNHDEEEAEEEEEEELQEQRA